MSVIPYRPEIDGLRAIAVLGVVVYHLNPAWLPGGFVGVDVFFVLSGYLIASIVFKEQAAGSFSYVGFWERRIKRILPALLLLVGVTLIVGWLVLFPPSFKLLTRQALGAATFHANHVVLSQTGGYWGNAAEAMPLLHTWSLAVEEQFYVLFPLFTALMLKISTRYRILTLGSFAVTGFIFCVILTSLRPAHAFYLLPARAWELAIGVLTAILANSYLKASCPKWVTTCSGIGILASMVLIEGGADFPGWKVAAPVLLTAFFIYGSPAESIFARLISRPVPVYIGKASYSLYLWHWPTIVFSKAITGEESLNTWQILVVAAVSVALTYFSFTYVENWGKHLRRPYIFAATATLFLASLSALLYAQYPCTVKILPEYETEWKGRIYDSFKGRSISLGARLDGVRIEMPAVVSDSTDGVGYRFFGGSKKALIIGDSHAGAAASFVERSLSASGYSGVFMVADGFQPYPGSKSKTLSVQEGLDFTRNQMRLVEHEKPNLIVLVVRQDIDPKNAKAILDHASALADISQAKLLVLGQPPVLPIGDVSAPAWFSWNKYKYGNEPLMRESRPDERYIRQQKFESLVRDNPRCLWFETRKYLLNQQGQPMAVGLRGLRYIDDDHISEAGGIAIEPAFIEFIRQSGL